MSESSASIPRRIAIAGPSGSGKSTTGAQLSRITGLPYIELDALHWLPDWTEPPQGEFRAKVAAALDGAGALDRPGWIVDGNYSLVRDLTWGQADLLIWLDFTLARTLVQLTRRTLRRRMRNELLWGTNREAIHMHLFSKDSLYVWVFKTHWRHRRQYPARFAEYPGLRVERVRTPRDRDRLVAEIARVYGAQADAAVDAAVTSAVTE